MLLDDLARPAGLALSTVRLTVELRRRAVELEALTAALGLSYQRIADARRTEIARMPAEMQDRVMPHLDRAAVGDRPGDWTRPRRRAGRLGRQPDRTGARRCRRGLESLRILARGIYPPRLADAGLAVSLEGWQQRSGVAVDVRMRGDEAALRENSELESCLYFCLVTALGALATGGGSRPSAALDIGPAEVGPGRQRSSSADGSSGAQSGDDGRSGSGGGVRRPGRRHDHRIRPVGADGGYHAARVDSAAPFTRPVSRRPAADPDSDER